MQASSPPAANLHPQFAKAAAVSALLFAVALWNAFGTPPASATAWFYLPIILAAALFGMPGAIAGAAVAALTVTSATLLRHIPLRPELWLELPLFFVFGGIVATLGHKSRTLEHLAYSDPLTGLPDNARILERLAEEVARVERDLTPLTLVLFDIDGLAAINERFDRQHGNRALCETAAAIRASIRTFDIPGRLEADEFALLLPDTTRDGAQLVAERVRRAVETRGAQSGVPFTVSAGIVEIGDGRANTFISRGRSAERYLGCAEKALFEARRTGRNRVVFYDPEMYGN